MSEALPTSDMQFDQAEFKGEPVAVACASCGAPIQATYYQVGQAITCEQCRWRIESEAAGGSPIGRFVKAAMLGVVAAAIGAGAYYAVRALTGYEMGHVASLRRYGIAATAPMFVPGLGAFVRLKQTLQSPREDARVGLAGPIWGLGATLATYGLYAAAGWPVLAAIAKFSAWLNLFNLLPVWQLDGGRAFAALTRNQRWGVVAACAAAYGLTREGLLLLLLLAAAGRAWRGATPSEPDSVVLVQYVGLVLSLALLATIHVTLPS